MTSRRERLAAAVAGGLADRPPVALWRHFPVDDQDPAAFARSTIEFQKAFDFDFVKVTPASSFAVRDWGVEDEWQGSAEGTRTYTRRVIRRPEDWERLPKLSPDQGALASCLAGLTTIVEALGKDVPVLATIFSPLAQAKNLAGEKVLLDHAKQFPENLAAGLSTVTDISVAFVAAARSLGIEGIFFAVQHAQRSLMDLPTYRRLAEAHDLRILEAADGLPFNTLHLHGTDIHFELAQSYPVSIVNWHDRETPPGLGEGKRRSGKAVCGGIARIDGMVLGDPVLIRREAEIALRETDGGHGLILGTGCVVPLTAPLGNLRAVRDAVEPA